ncbi:unnamed protein product [Nesidiocoris tenuis]|uniref:Uncharacterized protein n=1 Tax=Nesidiocoris tenuis TaxID=355587 RepID=A0A6H5HGB6_9HEMI|nr:unnamed protein product [Nesidiocoris tenuis]
MALLTLKDKFPRLGDSSRCLEEFYFTVSSWVASVQNLPTEDLSGFLLFETVFNKLPKFLKDAFCTSSLEGKRIPTVKDLLSFLSAKVEAVRNVPVSQTTRSWLAPTVNRAHLTKPNRSPSRHGPDATKRFSSLASLKADDLFCEDEPQSLTSAEDFDSSTNAYRFSRYNRTLRKVDCFFCQKDHFIYQCPEWTNLPCSTRIQLAESYQLCTRCLSNRHNTMNCPSDRVCALCKGTHHSMLHPEDDNKGGYLYPGSPNAQTSSRPSLSKKSGRSRSPSPSVRAAHTMACSQFQHEANSSHGSYGTASQLTFVNNSGREDRRIARRTPTSLRPSDVPIQSESSSEVRDGERIQQGKFPMGRPESLYPPGRGLSSRSSRD